MGGQAVHALGGRVVRALRLTADWPLAPVHRAWIRSVFAPDNAIGVYCAPRGAAKTWVGAQLCGLAMRPGSPLFHRGLEVLGVSGSLEQSRVLLRMARESLRDVEDDYRWLDSGQRLQVTHKATLTKLRILSSSGKRAMGLEGFSFVVMDEPGSYELRNGSLLFDACRQALGKRAGQRLLLLGTRAPADPGSWWPDLVDAGSGPGTHVTELRAPADEPWDDYQVIARVNPLIRTNPSLRATIIRERDAARTNPTLRRSFEAYRLNRTVAVHEDVLVDVEAWKGVEAREVPPRDGKPLVGLDLGSERSWSAAWCLWRNGRSECYALAPGIPSLEDREKADGQPRGLYRRLHQDGSLLVDQGLRVSRPSTLIEHLVSLGIQPAEVFCDRFLLGSLKDAVAGRWPIHPRVTRWSEASEDITGFRQLVHDGPLSILPECRALAAVSLGQASVVSDDQGSVRLAKKRHGRSRDDVAVCATLAAGALVRLLRRPSGPTWRLGGLVG